MKSTSRREFLSRSVGAGAALGFVIPESLDAAPSEATLTAERVAHQAIPDRFDPWIEIDPDALAHNTATVATLANGRPILAVLKNNAYGLGLTDTARLLSAHDAISGFAVVKPEDAIALRDMRFVGSGSLLPPMNMNWFVIVAVSDKV